jgi:hypothetical protein
MEHSPARRCCRVAPESTVLATYGRTGAGKARALRAGPKACFRERASIFVTL